MIPRYEIQTISKIWSDNTKFQTMFDVEIEHLFTRKKSLFHKHSESISKVKISLERISEIESIVKHDVIAVINSIVEQLPDEIGREIHFGLTSSDILDTTTSIQIRKSLSSIIYYCQKLLMSLYSKCLEWKDIICMGRTHGKNAEPISFGVKFLSFYSEIYRRLHDYENYYRDEITGKFSGAVGNYVNSSIELEEDICGYYGMDAEPHTNQIINRDHIAKLMSIGSLMASAIERMVTEIRLLHHSDVNEVNESFAAGQKGSSTMPHKKNPILSENLTGICRVIKSHFGVASDNINLWHERDISHSSAERLILPDHFNLLAYILIKANELISNLTINEYSIRSKIMKTKEYLSSYYLHDILLNTTLTRDKVYEIIQGVSSYQIYDDFHEHINKQLENITEYRVKYLEYQDIYDIFMKSRDDVFNKVEKVYPCPIEKGYV